VMVYDTICLVPGYFPNRIPGYISGEQGGIRHLFETHVEADKRRKIHHWLS